MEGNQLARHNYQQYHLPHPFHFWQVILQPSVQLQQDFQTVYKQIISVPSALTNFNFILFSLNNITPTQAQDCSVPTSIA